MILPGQSICGTTLSATSTLKLQELLFPASSVAVQVTVVLPVLKATLLRVVPLPFVAPERLNSTVMSEQLSFADGFQPTPL